MRQQGRGRGRGRGRRRNHSFQIIWGIVAIIVIIGLFVGYKLGFSENNQDETIVNAADNPSNGVDISITLTPTVEVTMTPTPIIIPTQVVEPTATTIPTPQIPNQIDANQEQVNVEDDIVTIPPLEEQLEKEPTQEPTQEPEKEPTQEVQKMVALTFDDGPYPPVTERIVNILKENESHATFFILGNRVDTYPETVKLLFEEGHQIGNHTYSHKDLTKLKVNEIEYEVTHSNDLINDNANIGDAYLRPPYGAKSDKVKSSVKVPLIFWSVDSMDWSSKNKNKIFKEIMDTVKDGDIILLHDLYPTTADAMELVIPELISQGYKLVTVQELLEAKGITPEGGEMYYNAR